MIYSPRLKKILEYCLIRDEYVSVEELAKLCKASTRTIFRELKDIDQDLKDYDLKLVSKPKAGWSLQGTSDQKQLLLQDLRVQGVAYLDKEERRNMLIFELLHSEDLEKLIHYASMFQVSEATISNDLDAITPWFQEYDLTLVRKPGIGVKLEGREEHFRRAITSVVSRSIQKNEQFQSINFLDSSSLLHQIFMDTGSQSILKLLDQDILTRILQVFETYQHELSLDRYASVGYIGLMIHLVIAIDRIQKHEEIKESQEVLRMVEHDPAYEQAKQMARYLENEFEIDIPDVEAAFIALHIKGAKLTRHEERDHTVKLKQLIQRMLMSFDQEYRVILLQDEELMNGLLTHMEPTITRLKNHLPIYNPLGEKIQQMYQNLFHQTKRACKLMEEMVECTVSDDEIAFLTMHMGASIERGKQEHTHRRIIACGVICASGIGVSALLSARILKGIPEGIRLTTLSMEDLNKHRYDDLELLISTFDLSITDRPVVRVTPLLNEADMRQLEEALQALWDHKAPGKQKQSEAMLYQIKDASNAAVDLLRSLQVQTISAEADIMMMIDQAAALFKEAEQVKDALLEREKLGSVIMEDMGFLLLHAQVEQLDHPYMQLLYPQGTCFVKYPAIHFVLVMLIPQHTPPVLQQVCSSVNRALIEEEAFLATLQTRQIDEIIEQLRHILEAFMKELILG